MAIALSTSTSGALASGTTATITLPTYTSTDYIVMILSRNQTQATPFTFSAAVTSITELAQAGTSRRVTAMRIVPNGTGQTTFTLTGSTSGVWSWWIAAYSGVDPALTIASASNTPGSNTTSVIEVPTAGLGYIATGNELGFSAAGVNATATWTTDGATVFNTGTAANAGLMVRTAAVTAGTQTFVPGNMDRGLAGTTRSESAVAFVLQPTGNAPATNLLANGSFETFTSGIGTGWADEHALTGPFTYSSTTTGVVDGSTAQRIQYTGQVTDNGTTSKGEIYQSLIAASPGDVLDFSVWVSGSWANIYAIIGIEAFLTGGTYISENDVAITSMTTTPTKYTVRYVCPPGSTYVAVYFQFPGIAPTTSWDVSLDNATLIKAGTAPLVNADFTGSGELTATVGPPGVAVNADFTGTGTLSATAVALVAVNADFTGAGTLTATAQQTAAVTAAFTGSGALTAAVTPVIPVTAAFTGGGTLTATVMQISTVTAVFGGTGTLTATATATGGTRTVTAAFTGSGSLTATATVGLPQSNFTVTIGSARQHRLFRIGSGRD